MLLFVPSVRIKPLCDNEIKNDTTNNLFIFSLLPNFTLAV